MSSKKTNMQKGLVSIITPCYNTGAIVYRLLDSILQQDYPLIEMFVVNDGSTDNSEEVIKSYIPKFREKGYSLKYLYQNNSGQSVALNNALKLVNGEYLTWPDSDDFFRTNNAISVFVKALQCADENIAMVRCLPTYLDEDTLQMTCARIFKKEYMEYDQFINCLYSSNFIWGAGNYLIKFSCFEKVNPTKEIYTEKNAGQNWQMLLPLLYSYKCLTLSESYFNVLERRLSHSRGQYHTLEEQIKKINSYERTVVETLKSIIYIDELRRRDYIDAINKKYFLERIKLSIRLGKKKDIYKQMIILRNSKYHVFMKLYLFLKLSCLPYGIIFIKLLRKLRQ